MLNLGEEFPADMNAVMVEARVVVIAVCNAVGVCVECGCSILKSVFVLTLCRGKRLDLPTACVYDGVW